MRSRRDRVGRVAGCELRCGEDRGGPRRFVLGETSIVHFDVILLQIVVYRKIDLNCVGLELSYQPR